MVEAWPGGRGGGGRLVVAVQLVLLLLGCCWAPLGQGRRLICWQAMLQCQEEPECSYAYSQYAEACAPVLLLAGEEEGAAGSASSPPSSSSPTRRRCPSHCISALIQLNHTRRGPALEDCDCDRDENCRATKRAIEPCLPRTGGTGGGGLGGGGGVGGGHGGVMGCTEARRRCDWDSRCSVALSRYMSHCGKLFNGLRCTEECRGVIEEMLAVPKALLLNDCVCDGLERPICESIKENMARLCFGEGGGQHHQHRDRDASSSSSSSNAAFGPGSSGALDDYYDEEEEEEDYEDEVAAAAAGPHEADDNSSPNHNNAASSSSVAFPGNGCPAPWTLLSSSAAVSILGPLLLLLLFFLSSSS